MEDTHIIATPGTELAEEAVRESLHAALEETCRGRRVLVLIPDHTRTMPLPFFFRTLVETLQGARSLDFMVALGTHPPLSEEKMQQLVGIRPGERGGIFRHVGLLHHDWQSPSAVQSLGALPEAELRALAGPQWHPSLAGDVDVVINQAAMDHDLVLIAGPVFPHEVVGFSGGAKYLFPGISGPQMINITHWLGALAGVRATIGVKQTPVRALIDAAASRLPTPVALAAVVMDGERPVGLFLGGMLSAWNAAADLSAQRNIRWCSRAYRRVLSCAAPMYDELWTAAKAMYKLEPVVAPGGELIIYAPHLEEVSRVHGKYIFAVGYHILPYFLEQRERFRDIPLSVLAHSTHVRGSGRMENGAECPDIRVTLASRISPADCGRLGLGYLDPASVHPEEWQDREAEGILYVPKAGEILYRLK